METSKPSGKYDTRSAERRLRDYAGNGQEHRQGRVAAARTLLEEFVALAGRYSLKTTTDEKWCSVVVGGITIFVSLDADRGVLQVVRKIPDGRHYEDVPLVFNPSSSVLEGTSIDPNIAPTPGGLTPWRSALDVLVEEVLKLAALPLPVA